VIGVIYVLFCPGYVLLAALFPGRRDIDILERLAFGTGLSVVVLILIGLALNSTPWGVRLDAVLLSLTAFVVIGCGIAYYRWRKLALQERFTLDLQFERTPWKDMSQDERIGLVALILLLVIVMGVTGYSASLIMTKDQYTQFYILGKEKTTESYPGDAVTDEPITITLHIANHEGGAVHYRIERVGDVGSERIATMQLSHEQSWEQPYTFTLVEPGENQKVEFVLYKGDEKEPYRSLYLWITVKEE
jgi:uncharacterized membrane protein